MRNTLHTLLTLSLSVALSGCMSYATTEPDYAISSAELSTSSNDFSSFYEYHRTEQIANAIVDYLHEQHPTLAAEFPSLRVRSVTLSNDLAKAMHLNNVRKHDIEFVLTDIFKQVEHALFADRPPSSYQTWPTDLIISAYEPTLSNTEVAALAAGTIPLVALCWGTVFVACPSKQTKIYGVEIKAYPPTGGVVRAMGTGASALYIQSQLMEEGPQFSEARKQQMNALVAATADAADKWIAAWEKSHE